MKGLPDSQGHADKKHSDNTVVFQALIDDVPMEEHGLYPLELGAAQTTNPIVMRRTFFIARLSPYQSDDGKLQFFQIVKTRLAYGEAQMATLLHDKSRSCGTTKKKGSVSCSEIAALPSNGSSDRGL